MSRVCSFAVAFNYNILNYLIIRLNYLRTNYLRLIYASFDITSLVLGCITIIIISYK